MAAVGPLPQSAEPVLRRRARLGPRAPRADRDPAHPQGHRRRRAVRPPPRPDGGGGPLVADQTRSPPTPRTSRPSTFAPSTGRCKPPARLPEQRPPVRKADLIRIRTMPNALKSYVRGVEAVNRRVGRAASSAWTSTIPSSPSSSSWWSPLALVMAFPQLALWLPEQHYGR